MSDIKIGYSNYEAFVLKADNDEPLVLNEEPGGWDGEFFKMVRNAEYHGVFSEFSSALIFKKEARDYIIKNYALGGINNNIRITRYKLKDRGDKVLFIEQETGLADFESKEIYKNVLSIRFNSDELESVIKSHVRDIFEIERPDSIDGDRLDPMELFKVELSGRTLDFTGESDVDTEYKSYTLNGKKYQKIDMISSNNNQSNYQAIVSNYISEGPERFTSVTDQDARNVISSGNMFFDRDQTEGVVTDLQVSWDITGLFGNATGSSSLGVQIKVYEWDGTNFNVISTKNLPSTPFSGGNNFNAEIKLKGNHTIEALKWNQGVSLFYYIAQQNSSVGGSLLIDKQNIRVVSSEFYEKSQDISCSFIHDTVSRLMYIITGKKDLFYSKYFGRTELGYAEDGEGGLMALISGFWARAFDPKSETYKSLQISMDDAIDSLKAVFNIGVAIETFGLTKKLRFEKLSHFYRDEVVVRMPNQLQNVKRTVDSDLYFSGTKIGYKYGSEFENEADLNDPNKETSTVTPIRKSSLKYELQSAIRADDSGLEKTRRKPQIDFPDESTSSDTHSWFLDLKRLSLQGTYTQKTWQDRLSKEPEGISNPNDFKGMFFTPLRMLLRHGFVLRSGLELYTKGFLKYASSKTNKALTMQFIGDIERSESGDILVSNLDRARFLPDIIECEHPVDDELLDWIKGTTPVLINGSYEDVPNVYFKFEAINENGESERFYFLEMDPNGAGKFKFQAVNELIIQ